ncbi:MAG: hypothetical protein ACE5K4_03390 [Candidatus Hydrothermarchaeota archaeon]
MHAEAILEIINFIIGLVVLAILVIIRKESESLDPDMLKAKAFLKAGFLSKTWSYIFLIGVIFVLHETIGTFKELFHFETYYLYELSESIFIILFIVLLKNWYELIKESKSIEYE